MTKPGSTLTTKELLRFARATALDIVAIDRVLELGYTLERAQRAVKPYVAKPVASVDADPGLTLVDRWVDGLHEQARLQTELRLALHHQRWMRERLIAIARTLREASDPDRLVAVGTEIASWIDTHAALMRISRHAAIEIEVACDVYLASPTGDI